jgi:single-stranded-DNA-specific exonuclease
METYWLETTCDEANAVAIAEAFDLPLPLARLLVARGYGAIEEVRLFLEGDLLKGLGKPSDFPGIIEAVERIWAAIHAKKRLVVYGDFDVDGVVATATLVTALRRLGAEVTPFLPLRDAEGYGLTMKGLRRCLEEISGLTEKASPDPFLLITVDCGINAVSEVEWLKQQGIDVIITDHHEPGPTLPSASVIINPRVAHAPGAEALCGSGLAFKLVYALVERGRSEGWYTGASLSGDLLPGVGLATVADVVPLRGENRTLVTHALRHWDRASIGLKSLLYRAAQNGREEISTSTFAFLLGPRINAAGRMGSAMVAYELLTTTDRDRAAQLAAELHNLNAERMTVEKRLMTAARLQCGLEETPIKKSGAVVAAGPKNDGWHEGVLGIVAARLNEMTGHPAVVIALEPDGTGRGSVRAGEGYQAVEALQGVQDLLHGFGGHARAAGLTLRSGCLEAFCDRFKAECERQRSKMDERQHRVKCDGWLSHDEVTLAFLEAQQRLAPFGEGHGVPRWGLRDVYFDQVAQMGQGGDHLQMSVRLSDGRLMRGVWFRRGHLVEKIRMDPGPYQMLFELQRNDFREKSTVEFRMIALASDSKGVLH